jgi:hypothetical protein
MEVDPLAGCVPGTPTPPIDSVVAFVVVHVRVDDCPALIVDGLAEKVFTTGSADVVEHVFAGIATEIVFEFVVPDEFFACMK